MNKATLSPKQILRRHAILSTIAIVSGGGTGLIYQMMAGRSASPKTWILALAFILAGAFLASITLIAVDYLRLLLVLALPTIGSWASPFLSLMGAILLALPATFFPPRARRAWLAEVLESFAVRKEHGTSWFMVMASYVRTWPSDLLDEWLDYLKRRPNDYDLSAAAEEAAPAQASGSYWKRHRTEIVWGIVWALVFAPAAAIAYEAVTETMHHSGYRWLWEPGQGH